MIGVFGLLSRDGAKTIAQLAEALLEIGHGYRREGTLYAGVMLGVGVLVLLVYLAAWAASVVSVPEAPASTTPCPACSENLTPGAALTACGACSALTHTACFERDGRCRSMTCLGGINISPAASSKESVAEPVIAISAAKGAGRCPYCHEDLDEAEATSTCPACETEYHYDCLAEAGCTLIGCSLRRTERA